MLVLAPEKIWTLAHCRPSVRRAHKYIKKRNTKIKSAGLFKNLAALVRNSPDTCQALEKIQVTTQRGGKRRF